MIGTIPSGANVTFTARDDVMKIGDLVKHKWRGDIGLGLITKITRNGPPGFPVHVHTMWNRDGKTTFQSVEQVYLEVINEAR